MIGVKDVIMQMNNGLSLVPTMSGDHQVWVRTLSEYTPHSLQLTTLTFNPPAAYDWRLGMIIRNLINSVCVESLAAGLWFNGISAAFEKHLSSGELTDLNECTVTNLKWQNIESHQQK